MNESFSNIIRPVVNGYYTLEEKIGEGFNSSENRVIKAIRGNYHNYLEYSRTFTTSMYEGETSVVEEKKEKKAMK